MFGVHAVFVSPGFGIGIFAVRKTVYGYIVDGEGISGVLIVADFDSSFPRRAVVTVVESAVIYCKVRRFCRRCLTVKKNRFAVGVESAVYKGCFRHLL